jgi:hypothetical protein
MAKRKITLTWEGEIADDWIKGWQDDVTACVEFLIDQEDAVLIIEEDGKELFRYKEQEGEANG